MDAILAIKPTAEAQPVVHARPAPAVQQAVATDLSPAKTVTAADTAAPARNDMPRAQDLYQHDAIIDPATREIVYRMIDVRTRQVVRQIPEQAQLRMQAYTQALANDKSPTAAMLCVDLVA